MQILQEVDQYNSYMDQVVRESEIFNEAEEQVHPSPPSAHQELPPALKTGAGVRRWCSLLGG